jgi:hypothetical protein
MGEDGGSADVQKIAENWTLFRYAFIKSSLKFKNLEGFIFYKVLLNG